MTDRVQQVKRRMVYQQVQLLRQAGRWAAMQEDVVADCVLAAGGDAVVADRLFQRWAAEGHSHGPDLTAEEEARLIDYVRTRGVGFQCDCGTCRPDPPHGTRFQHG